MSGAREFATGRESVTRREAVALARPDITRKIEELDRPGVGWVLAGDYREPVQV
jgi:hypothetical protein